MRAPHQHDAMTQPAKSRRSLAIMLILGLAASLWAVVASRPSSGHEESNLVSGLRQVGRVFRSVRGRSTELGKNHELVKAAFADVIAEANESTVRVIVDGRQVALGTVISRNGLVLTKLSELEGKVRIALGGSTRYEAQIEHRIRDLDLAMLRVRGAPPLRPVSLSDAGNQPLVGSWVAIPGGRTDLPIAVGVVSSPVRAIHSRSALLGVHVAPDVHNGALIDSVISGSSADRSGLRPGDIVKQVDTQDITGLNPLPAVIRRYAPGDDIQLVIHRPKEKKNLTIKATLGSDVQEESDEAGHTGGRLNDRRSGFDQVIQHDCPLRANQCGGPLIDARGRVIGINIAKAGRVETYALPVAIVRQTLGALADRRDLDAHPQPRRLVESRISIASIVLPPVG